MNLRTLRVFVEVVRQGGFTQAADVVSLTQSSVSKAVKALEVEVGVPLLNRIGHKTELTAAGEIVYRRALVLLTEKNHLLAEIDALQELKGGTLRIGLPPVGCGVLFAKMFTEYRRRYPQVDIELIEHGGNRLREFLEAGAIDIAALLVSKNDAIAYQDVRNEPLVVVLQADHPLAGYHQLNFKDLHAEPFILFEEGFTLNQLILAACERRKVSPRITARSGQIDFIVDLVTAGLGVAFLPRMLATKHRHPGISLVPLNEPHTDWRIALAWRKGTQLPPAAIAWLELAKTLAPLKE